MDLVDGVGNPIESGGTINAVEGAGKLNVTSNKGNVFDATPLANHSTTTSTSINGIPNSSVDIVDKNGNIVTRRWFDSNGNQFRDIDYTNHGNPKNHPEWPHEHGPRPWIKGVLYMKKIDFEDFKRIMSYDITKKQDSCIEIWFGIDDSSDYYSSWLGKLKNKENGIIEYWFGLTEDGQQAYEYDSFEQLANAKVFYGKSMSEIWSTVSLFAIDACDVEDRLPFYLELV
jgi:hypothetical protein